MIDHSAEIVQQPKKENTEMFEASRKTLLAEFPESDSGVDFHRIDSFFSELGLERKRVVVFDKKDKKKVVDVLHFVTNLSEIFEYAQGMYLSELDIVLFMKSEKDDYCGSIFREGTIVHELAHGSSGFNHVVVSDGENLVNPRVGFAMQRTDDWGWFLEEGWAELLRAYYIRLHATDEEISALTYSRGDDFSLEDTLAVNHPTTNEILPLSIVYHRNFGSGLAVNLSAYAGYGLEILCKLDPNLFHDLVNARISVEGLRKVAQRVNALEEGLYGRLQRCQYSASDFADRMAHIATQVAELKDIVVPGDNTGNKGFWKLQF